MCPGVKPASGSLCARSAVPPQGITKIVRRRKKSPKRYTRPAQDYPHTALTVQVPAKEQNLPDTAAKPHEPTQTTERSVAPRERPTHPQLHLQVARLQTCQPRPTKILTRNVGTDPKDPTVFPLAKQKTLLCYGKKQAQTSTPSHSTSVQVRPVRSQHSSRPRAEVACQTDHLPSSGSSFRH